MRIALGKALIGLVAAGAAAVGVYSMAGSGTPQLPRLTDNPQPIEGLAVFPGAVGFGTRTRAGRGGKVLIVDSLADAGRGTLREALSQDGPRTIVFHVGGVIQLKSHLFIDRPFVTIAGQTAPGDGIVLKDFGIVITTNDVLLQHVRVRPGNQGAVRVDHNDAIAILGPTGAPGGAYNVVIDHVSASWGEDEVINTWFSPHDITISWSIVSEALSRSRHPKETHSAAVLIGDGTTRTSLHHNLMAHNDIRNPLIASGGTHDVVNNVIYNWGALSTEIVENAPTEVNVIGNYYRAGRSSVSPYPVFIEAFSPAGNPRVFVAGNMHYGHEPPANAWDMVQYGWKGKGAAAKYRASDPFKTAPIAASTATDALAAVLAGAGATLPRRDAVDVRVASEVQSGAGRIIDTPGDVGGYPAYGGGAAPTDTDRDGMPDDWERAMKLDPASPADSAKDADGNGYTNLEEYLHTLTRGPRPSSAPR